MIETILGAGVGCVVTGVISYLVYSYRNVILYSSRSHAVHFTLDGRNLVFSDEYTSPQICVTSITLRNKGLRALDDTELHWNMSDPLFKSEVSKTRTISPNAVIIAQQDKYVSIRIPHFPKGEEIEIEAFSNGRENAWCKIEGTGGRYKVESVNRYITASSLASGVIWTLGAMIAAAVVMASVADYLSGKVAQTSKVANENVQSLPPPQR